MLMLCTFLREDGRLDMKLRTGKIVNKNVKVNTGLVIVVET